MPARTVRTGSKRESLAPNSGIRRSNFGSRVTDPTPHTWNDKCVSEIPMELSGMPRRPLGNVLVATDFSDNARRAVNRAASLPIAPGASLTICHVVPGGLPTALTAELETAARSELSRLANEAAALAQAAGSPRLEVVTAVGQGSPVTEIARLGVEHEAELTVVGRHGQRRFRDLLLGSVAERIVRKSELPVLIVRAVPAGPYRKPLAALDAWGSSQRALLLAIRMLDARTETIEVVHAVDTTLAGMASVSDPTGARLEQYLDECRRTGDREIRAELVKLGDVGIRWNLHLDFGDARPAILTEAQQLGADLLALGTHGHSRLEGVLISSVAEAVVRHAACDVLLARELPRKK
jgi:nucleotide-binding universal stress UspA family protein